MKKCFVGLLLGLMVIGVVAGGCGERTETTRYYYSPSWTKDAEIILIGGTQSVDKDILGGQLGSSYTEYVFTIYPSGTGESAALFDVTDAPPYAMSCSPNRDYVAYLGELRSGEYGKIFIRSISTEAFTGMKELELTFYPKIKSFDWSDDGNQIVYCTTNEVKVRDWNDFNGATEQVVTAEANLEFVSWMYGNRIAFVYTSGGNKRLSLINPASKARTDLSAAVALDAPQISPSDTNTVYGIAGAKYVSVNTNTEVSLEVASSFTGLLPRISPDGDMITYSKSGEDSGVYIMYTASGTEETVIQ